MQDFKNVDVWKKAHALTLRVFIESRSLPKEEVFGITIQLRRGATAIASKIAEGCAREMDAEFAVDLRRAAASCNDLEYLILLAHDLDMWKPEVCDALTSATVEVRKMLYGLLRKM